MARRGVIRRLPRAQAPHREKRAMGTPRRALIQREIIGRNSGEMPCRPCGTRIPYRPFPGADAPG